VFLFVSLCDRDYIVGRTLILPGIFSCFLLFGACSSKPDLLTNNSNSKTPASVVPPFSTQEPTRYQAVRTITSSNSGSTESRIIRSRIARDGLLRREEYETTQGDVLIYLEIPAGRFALLPAAKLFAELNEDLQTTPLGKIDQGGETQLSTDRLLNEVKLETTYERLGSETINGRGTTSYRITTAKTGPEPGAETLIWIDDTLKMPVKWETKATSGERQTKTVMELSQIVLVVDATSFRVPAHYRKVSLRTLNDRAGQTKPESVSQK
jgi:hypothetical protein